MVNGMLTAFLTTLVVVAVLLLALFRSFWWALLAMVPVTWTVLVTYGLIGWIGRDYDMPVAVLSTLVLGIGVDFAIHFVSRYRALLDEHGSIEHAVRGFFGEPARALTRNAVTVGLGFTPLLLSSLVPYVVVGVLLSTILLLSWLTTMLVLPAAASLVRPAETPRPALTGSAPRTLVSR